MRSTIILILLLISTASAQKNELPSASDEYKFWITLVIFIDILVIIVMIICFCCCLRIRGCLHFDQKQAIEGISHPRQLIENKFKKTYSPLNTKLEKRIQITIWNNLQLYSKDKDFTSASDISLYFPLDDVVRPSRNLFPQI